MRGPGPAPMAQAGPDRAGPAPRHLPARQLDESANMPGSYEPPCVRVITPSRLAALIMATRETSAAIWSSS